MMGETKRGLRWENHGNDNGWSVFSGDFRFAEVFKNACGGYATCSISIGLPIPRVHAALPAAQAAVEATWAAFMKSAGLDYRKDRAIPDLVCVLIAANLVKAMQAIAAPGLRGWFVGQVMKETRGMADQREVQALVAAIFSRAEKHALEGGA